MTVDVTVFYINSICRSSSAAAGAIKALLQVWVHAVRLPMPTNGISMCSSASSAAVQQTSYKWMIASYYKRLCLIS
jgi:hypothetical protein